MIVSSGVTSIGVMYVIDDSYMASPGSLDERRIADEQCRVAYEIIVENTKEMSA